MLSSKSYLLDTYEFNMFIDLLICCTPFSPMCIPYSWILFQNGELLIPNVTCMRAYYKALRAIWEQEVVFNLNDVPSFMMDEFT
jgi:hypothetical protein